MCYWQPWQLLQVQLLFFLLINSLKACFVLCANKQTKKREKNTRTEVQLQRFTAIWIGVIFLLLHITLSGRSMRPFQRSFRRTAFVHFSHKVSPGSSRTPTWTVAFRGNWKKPHSIYYTAIYLAAFKVDIRWRDWVQALRGSLRGTEWKDVYF